MITILGLGNIILKDEGLGVHFIRWFEKRHSFGPDVRIVDGGTLGFLLLDTVCESERLLVIDAVRVDAPPGSIFRFTPADLPGEYLSQGAAHDAAFLQVLIQADLLDKHPKECVIIAVVPEDMKGLGVDISPDIEKKFIEIEKQVLKELECWGVSKSTGQIANM